MERTPDGETPGGLPGTSPGESPEEAPAPDVPTSETRVHPTVDVSPALHEAGHEVHDLGWDDVPDTGPVVHPDAPSGPEDPLDFVIVQMPTD